MIVKQFRYYGDENYEKLNAPNTISADNLISGSIFNGINCSEIKIKTMPGIELSINDQTVLIGETGIYEILYRENTTIHSIKLTEKSINLLTQNSKVSFFIITFIQKED